MQRYFGALTIVLLLAMVLTRILLMKRKGTSAMNFGKTDRTDFLILPFAVFYFYVIFAAAFDLPAVSQQDIFRSVAVAWAGVVFCLAGLIFLLLSLISFGKSFRVGIDQEHPDELVTTGVFALSRNPIYVAFASILLGEFLLFSNWILLVYVIAGAWLFNRQALREEEYLSRHYGQKYADYRHRVRRYL